MRFDKSRTGPWLILAAATLWGTTGTAQALAPAAAQPAAIGTVRLIIGGLALFILAAAQGHLRGPVGRWPLKATAVAAIGMALYQLTFFAAVQRTGVAVGTIVGIGSAPILGGLLAWLIRHENPGRRWLIATVLAIIGCALLIVAPKLPNPKSQTPNPPASLTIDNSPLTIDNSPPSPILSSPEFPPVPLSSPLPSPNPLIPAPSSSSLDPLGILLALTAGLSYAAYTVYSKELLVDRPPDTVMAVIFCLGALLLSPLLLTADLTWLLQPSGAAVALHLGVITVALAYALFARGLRVVPVATAVTLTLAEPLTAAALGILVLGERLTPLAFTGIALLLTALLFLTRPINN